jgi:hypothetical protein
MKKKQSFVRMFTPVCNVFALTQTGSSRGFSWGRYISAEKVFEVYMHGMGMVITCPTCDSALIRVVHAKGRYWLDMRGVCVLQISTDATPL